jgi:hypothetical protein
MIERQEVGMGLNYCEAALGQYLIYQSMDDRKSAQAVCEEAKAKGCEWAKKACPTGFASSPNTDFGPDLRGVFRPGVEWPPCPTPWGPGPQALRFPVPGAVYAEEIADP